jgi:2-methylcitrate dehydratase PrpD
MQNKVHSPLTRQYAHWSHQCRLENLSSQTLEVAHLGFVDCLGVMLAGANEPVLQALRDWTTLQGGQARSRCVGQSERLPASTAALINATAAHALDFDDFAFSNHPSAVLCPAILAAADASPTPVTGALALRAYVLGYEIWADAFVREPDLYYDKGWHPTAIFGTLGAAVAASVVMDLTEDQICHALALAASCAGGIFENFGTMAKPLHGGRASSAGVMAAEMAASGIQASEQALEGPHGMLRAFSPAGRVDLTSALHENEAWWILRYRLNLKRFPVVGSAQRGVEAMLGWREGNPQIRPEDIEKIHIVVSQRHAAVMPYKMPKDALQAKFSLPFALVCALLKGRVGLNELQNDFIQSAQVQQLMNCVTIETTEAFEPGWRDAAPFDQLWVHEKGGRITESPAIRRPRGHADLPMNSAQVREKFIDTVMFAGPSAVQADATYQAWMTFPKVQDIRELSWPELHAHQEARR